METRHRRQSTSLYPETGQFVLDLPEALFLSDDPALELIWTFPLTSLEYGSEGYRAKLQTVIPATSFRLEIVLDPNCGYVCSEDASLQRITPFSWNNDRPRTHVGSCGIMIQEEE